MSYSKNEVSVSEGLGYNEWEKLKAKEDRQKFLLKHYCFECT